MAHYGGGWMRGRYLLSVAGVLAMVAPAFAQPTLLPNAGKTPATKPEAETWSRTIWRSADQFPKEFPPQAEGAKVSIEFIDVATAGMAASGGALYLTDIAPAKITGNATASGVVASGAIVLPIDIN